MNHIDDSPVETNHAFINIGASPIRTGSISLNTSALSIVSTFHIITTIINFKNRIKQNPHTVRFFVPEFLLSHIMNRTKDRDL